MDGPDADNPFEPAELKDRDRLRKLQLERLQWTVERVYASVPRYREKFAAAGVTPGDLKSLADLAKFPFTTKQDLRDNYPFGMFAVPREKVVRIHASSGTTGKPTVVGYSQRDIRENTGLREAAEVLAKPFTTEDMAQVLGTVVS